MPGPGETWRLGDTYIPISMPNITGSHLRQGIRGRNRAAEYLSEIIAHKGNNHKMIGALGHAKTLPDIIMGCETIEVNGRPFTLIVLDESVSDPALTDRLIPVGRLKEDVFDVSFRIPLEAHIDGVDLTTYQKYGSRIITPGPDS
jgi:hypothetical protein